MTTKVDPKKSALLLLDMQNGIVNRLPEPQKSTLLDNAVAAIAAARHVGATVAYVHAALTPADFAAVPDFNPIFAPFKSNPERASAFLPDAPQTQIHERLTPQAGDLFHRKTRVGTFQREPSMVLLDEFRSKEIDTVFVGGLVSSGAVESAVRQLSDLDFRIFVVEDCCADFDAEVHKVLCEKIFTKLAVVVKSSDISGMF
jgi:nicotinamidase-related amidase